MHGVLAARLFQVLSCLAPVQPQPAKPHLAGTSVRWCPVISTHIQWPHLCLRVRERRLRRQVPSNSLDVTPAAMPGHRRETDAAERRPAQASRARRHSENWRPAHTSALAAQKNQAGGMVPITHVHCPRSPCSPFHFASLAGNEKKTKREGRGRNARKNLDQTQFVTNSENTDSSAPFAKHGGDRSRGGVLRTD